MASTLVANGISINYRLDGRKDGSPDAPVVMLSNSLLSSYPMWDDQIDALTEDFQVLRYDTRGHGGTDAPAEPYSIDIFVEDVVGLLDGLGIERVHFVGLSMGGFIAQLLAVKHPDRVISLSLCDTASKSKASRRFDTAWTRSRRTGANDVRRLAGPSGLKRQITWTNPPPIRTVNYTSVTPTIARYRPPRRVIPAAQPREARQCPH
jgi:3-oxoadipate enol-lactonase